MTQRQAELERSARAEEDPAAASRVRATPLTREERVPATPVTHEERVPATPVTREEFCSGFDRCFDRVYAYVGGRVDDRERCERIVHQVLTASLDLLVERSDEGRELRWLKASSDRLIGLEIGASAGATESQR